MGFGNSKNPQPENEQERKIKEEQLCDINGDCIEIEKSEKPKYDKND